MTSTRLRIRALLARPAGDETLVVRGFVRTVRAGKNVTFVALNDGSCFANLQVVLDAGVVDDATLAAVGTGASVECHGVLAASLGGGQAVELRATSLRVLGAVGADYPLQKKRHSLEFLREIAHLRPRANTFGAVFRVRSAVAQAVHRFFEAEDFAYVHTPILTSIDCEGGGEMFRVTTLDVEPPRDGAGRPRIEDDFFGKPAMLTVSGQLAGECLAMGLGQIYTFGPTFRAENSNTSRHAAEFWMIEPEAAFYDLDDDAALAERCVRALVGDALERCAEDLAFFDAQIERGLLERLRKVRDASFERMTYTEAVARLERAGRTFEFPVGWGLNLQAEHERYLTEEVVGRPLVVTDYPKGIKAFYMRRNDDGRTVAAMDLLVPGVGELIGGSQREERLDVLCATMAEHGLPQEAYGFYLDTRRHGTVPHAGFGLGFERFLMFLTGVENIRDVIPFPRTPRHCAY